MMSSNTIISQSLQVVPAATDRQAVLKKCRNLIKNHKTASPEEIHSALESVEQYLAVKPTAAFWDTKGSLLLIQKNLKEASACFKEAVRLAPEHHAYHYHLAAVSEKEGEYKQCIESCDAIPSTDAILGKKALALKERASQSLAPAKSSNADEIAELGDTVLVDVPALAQEPAPPVRSAKWNISALWAWIWGPSNKTLPVIKEKKELLQGTTLSRGSLS